MKKSDLINLKKELTDISITQDGLVISNYRLKHDIENEAAIDFIYNYLKNVIIYYNRINKDYNKIDLILAFQPLFSMKNKKLLDNFAIMWVDDIVCSDGNEIFKPDLDNNSNYYLISIHEFKNLMNVNEFNIDNLLSFENLQNSFINNEHCFEIKLSTFFPKNKIESYDFSIINEYKKSFKI